MDPPAENQQLTGSGLPPPVPDIVVEEPEDTPLAAGRTIRSFGKATVGQAGSRLSFIIRNSGEANLLGISVEIEGLHPGDFELTAPDVNALGPGGNTEFGLIFRPLSAGARSAVLRIFSNDSDEDPFDINLIGTALIPVPEIAVEQPLRSGLVDGVAKRSFGTVKVGTRGPAKVFVIRNTGTAPLSGLSVSAIGQHKSNFIVTPPRKKSLLPGDKTTFTVALDPSRVGTRVAAISIKSNDADENPFTVRLVGLGVR